jgi:hypothetical protein
MEVPMGLGGHHEEDMGLALAALVAIGATAAEAQQKPAFIVNAASDFWKLAEAGVAKAQKELPGYELQFHHPVQGTAALQNPGPSLLVFMTDRPNGREGRK